MKRSLLSLADSYVLKWKLKEQPKGLKYFCKF